MFYSPLRYPGGKNRLSEFIGQVCLKNGIDGHYVEPFSGGASVALRLLIEGVVERITLNDFDRSIYAFWYSVLNHTEALCERIESAELTVEHWHLQKAVQKRKASADLLSLGFSTFFLNRTNRSGIITGGLIGGLEQKGKYKIGCRFNKKALIERIQRIAGLKHRIELYHLDALSLIQSMNKEPSNTNALLYFDPPYYAKGSTLYMNYFNDGQHFALAEAIRKIKTMHWMVSYDAEGAIADLYDWVGEDRVKHFDLHHFAYKKRVGKEVLFFSEDLRLDTEVRPSLAKVS